MSAPKQTALCSDGSLAYRGIRLVLARLLRVPFHAASIPVGAGELLDAFHPAIGWLRIKQVTQGFFFVMSAGGTVVLTLINENFSETSSFLLTLWLPLTILVVGLIWTLLCLRLRYDCTWYVLTERALRIRRGLIVIQETTITYENVQNVSVTQGPLQRLFGISNIVVETAGGGAASGQSEQGSPGGLIEGVGRAEALRERIMTQVRASRTAGLGDDPLDERSIQAPQPRSSTQEWSEMATILRAIRDDLRRTADS